MYNRYIPQSDGSYRRSYVPDRPTQISPRQRQEEPRATEIKSVPTSIEPERKEPDRQPNPPAPAPVCPRGRQRCQSPTPRSPQRKQAEPEHRESGNKDGNVMDFLRNLLPKDFDTGDLLVVLLLLLMAGDCKEDQNSALLTLVLYLFM